MKKEINKMTMKEEKEIKDEKGKGTEKGENDPKKTHSSRFSRSISCFLSVLVLTEAFPFPFLLVFHVFFLYYWRSFRDVNGTVEANG